MRDGDQAGRSGGYRYLFGPVPSRRLGRSLGIDLVPLKTCTFNCRFCEVGRTTDLVHERKPYVSAEAALGEFDHWLQNDGRADTVTLAGSGEPTLNSEMGAILAGIKARCDLPRALLTNSSLLHLPEVRAAAVLADIVKVSLSAWDQASMQAINRPAPGVRFADVVSGLRAFRSEFSGRMWMEVFIMAGLNDTPDAVERIAELAALIRPDRVQLNTVVRPPAEPDALPVSAATLDQLAGAFDPPAEVIASFGGGGREGGKLTGHKLTGQALLAMLERRPCTADDVRAAFAAPVEEVGRRLAALMASGRVQEQRVGDVTYYLASR